MYPSLTATLILFLLLFHQINGLNQQLLELRDHSTAQQSVIEGQQKQIETLLTKLTSTEDTESQDISLQLANKLKIQDMRRKQSEMSAEIRSVKGEEEELRSQVERGEERAGERVGRMEEEIVQEK